MHIFYLNPRGALHVGERIAVEREATMAYVPSDTLYAALVSAWVQQGADVAGRTQPGQLAVTSAMPAIGTLRLYPMPMGIAPRIHDDALQPKARKAVKWVSQGIFDALCAAQDLRSECDPDQNFVQGGAVWLLRTEFMQARTLLSQNTGDLTLWREQVAQRVTVDRGNSASSLFEAGRIQFAPNVRLWFAARGAGVAWVRPALNLLQDSGLGGLRSTGHGAFTLADEATWPDAALVGDYGITLSRYVPNDAAEAQAALNLPSCAYSLSLVGGWCNDDEGKAWRRRQIRMVNEGAVLGGTATGRLVDVMPLNVGMTRPVFRNGQAFLVPIAVAALPRGDI